MAGATAAGVREFVRRCAEEVTQQRAYLTDLDAAIGDADHGENMYRGMAAAAAAVTPSDDADTGTSGRADAGTFDAGESEGTESGGAPKEPVGTPLKTVATTLMSSVGGAAGPLYGTAFLRAANTLSDRPEPTAEEVVRALRAAYEGVLARGKAEPGEKTMIDAWDPAVRAAEQAVAEDGDLSTALARAAEAAESGAAGADELVARKGRASYLGTRSAGHRDPGAASTALLFRTLAETRCP